MQWFYTVYNSKYCDEKWDTLTCDWTFEEFLELENQISILVDMEKAAEADMERQEAIKRLHQNPRGN